MKGTKKIILLFFLMILSVYGNVAGNPVTSGNTVEKTEEKKEWKSNELKPDLDKDGKKDKLVIMYLIEPDRVVTKFIPYITDDKGKSVKGKEVEKIFGKSNFDNDFGNFMTSFIDSYPKKEVARIFDVLDEESGMAFRGTFIVNPEGKIVAYEVNDGGIGRDASELVRRAKAAKFVHDNPGLVCPAKWKEGEATLKPGLDLVGKI